jgi:hypothetical protein
MSRWLPWAMVALALGASPLRAAVHYVDPVNGDMAGDGSAAHPWRTLQEVFEHDLIESRAPAGHPHAYGDPLVAKNAGAPVKAGDTIKLRTGYHGRIDAVEYYNADYITIEAEEGHTPTVASVELRSVSKWIVRGLTISPSFADPYETRTLLQFSSHGWSGPSYDCIVESCTLYSQWDTSAWTSDDWNERSCNGINLPGDDMVARDNYLKNTNFAISVSGDHALVEGNVIENFSGDGMRGLGDHGVFQYNIVKNLYLVNSNHPDGFQSWSVGEDGVGSGVVTGIVLRGNTILNYEDPNQPFRGNLQGIGCFDGMFADWIVENNVVITDHWHGITLSGALDSRVVNNTVVDIDAGSPGPPWIQISDHKDGTPSARCVVRNNLATDFSVSGEDMVQDHNIEIDLGSQGYDDFFADYAGRDLHLKAGSPAVDAGSADLAPAIDRDGTARPGGAGYDVGAYELVSALPALSVSDATVVETDTGTVASFTVTLSGPD